MNHRLNEQTTDRPTGRSRDRAPTKGLTDRGTRRRTGRAVDRGRLAGDWTPSAGQFRIGRPLSDGDVTRARPGASARRAQWSQSEPERAGAPLGSIARQVRSGFEPRAMARSAVEPGRSDAADTEPGGQTAAQGESRRLLQLRRSVMSDQLLWRGGGNLHRWT